MSFQKMRSSIMVWGSALVNWKGPSRTLSGEWSQLPQKLPLVVVPVPLQCSLEELQVGRLIDALWTFGVKVLASRAKPDVPRVTAILIAWQMISLYQYRLLLQGVRQQREGVCGEVAAVPSVDPSSEIPQ